uniref:Uncharacterized protein n=2 Tax=Physcomitrium patens TaxID=3218 RepID=A0A2K1KJ51_PHYPA|nr:hypothetical protein PHYPA_007473 [Physcomitrium patens]
MEKVVVLKSQDLGLTLLQPRKHAGKAPCKSQRDHRIWRTSTLKGLGEIEVIDKEEVSIKMMQSLERFMRAYPDVWSESSLQHLLVEIADIRYSSSQNCEADERLQTIINQILVPTAKILEDERGFMMVEREKIQEVNLALQRAQEAYHHVCADLKEEKDRSARYVEELGKALEENRAAAEEAERKLAAKEQQTNDIIERQKDIILRLVSGEPSGFVQCEREAIQTYGLVHLEDALKHILQQSSSVSHQVENKILFSVDQISECSSSSENERGNADFQIKRLVHEDGDKPALPISLTNLSVKLLGLVVSEVFQQMMESYGRVRSPLSVPWAIAGFWIGLTYRMIYLVVTTLFSEVVKFFSQLLAIALGHGIHINRAEQGLRIHHCYRPIRGIVVVELNFPRFVRLVFAGTSLILVGSPIFGVVNFGASQVFGVPRERYVSGREAEATMVLLLLEIKAELENITNLVPKGGSDGTEYTYYFKIKCGGCGTVSDKETSVTPSELYDIPKSKGSANLVQKCKFCAKVGNITAIPGREKPYTMEDSESGKFVPIGCFDCRGIEPVEFSFKDGWAAEGLTGTKFVDIDLSEEWSEYDEKAAESVGILNMQHRFVVTK